MNSPGNIAANHARHVAAGRARHVAVAVAWLTAAMFVVFAATGWWALDRDGTEGLQAAAIAANVCWLSSCVALVTAGMTQNTQFAIHGIMGGMLVRMFAPGLIGLIVHTQQGPLARAGFLRYILVFFLASLVVETCLMLRMLNAGKTAAPAPTKVL